MGSMLEPLIGSKAAAELLGINWGTLLRWTSQGRVSCVRLGRRVLYEPADLRRFIKQGKRQARPESRGAGGSALR